MKTTATRNATAALVSVLSLTILVALDAEAQDAGPKYRQLAPGVLTTIPADPQPGETVSEHDLVELRAKPQLEWEPNFTPKSRTLYEMASGVRFRHRIWSLEMSFKPLRMMQVDIPQPSGKMQRKLIWYLIYSVKNVGGQLNPVRQEDGTFKLEPVAEEIRFIPQFVLDSHEFQKAYLDRVIPAAIRPIELREDPNRRLLNTVQMSHTPIPVSTDRIDRSVWGVAIWEDIDPRIDFFSVYVEGLSNAYRWEDPPGVYKPGDPPGKGRRFKRKTLKLNFWRPGDDVQQHEQEIRFGTPEARADLYKAQPGVDYTWVYR